MKKSRELTSKEVKQFIKLFVDATGHKLTPDMAKEFVHGCGGSEAAKKLLGKLKKIYPLFKNKNRNQASTSSRRKAPQPVREVHYHHHHYSQSQGTGGTEAGVGGGE
ncbi:MAG: hypothetical protein AAB276_06710 [Pseudomonadota bacterium]